MELAKQCVDVGLFTNRLDEMSAFYAGRVGLKFEEILPVGNGVRQHRYGLNGSVLKINHSRDPLSQRRSGGYRLLRIASPSVSAPQRLTDPDGNPIELVPPGLDEVRQIEIQIGVTDETAFQHFLAEAIEAQRIGPRRFRLGETIISIERDPAAARPARGASSDAMTALTEMRAVGWRYITIQVRECDAAHRRLTGRGAWEGAPPVTLGEVARISFVRDPDGNWIEISQRASLTGALPKA